MVDNNEKCLKAIHRLIIESRSLAFSKESEQNSILLDGVEYLVALILEKENKTDFFDEYLKKICDEFKFTVIYSKFKNKTL